MQKLLQQTNKCCFLPQASHCISTVQRNGVASVLYYIRIYLSGHEVWMIKCITLAINDDDGDRKPGSRGW